MNPGFQIADINIISFKVIIKNRLSRLIYNLIIKELLIRFYIPEILNRIWIDFLIINFNSRFLIVKNVFI